MTISSKLKLDTNQLADFSRYQFTQEQCDQLYDMTCVDDAINVEVKLPELIKFSYTQSELIESFLICRQLWVQGLAEDKLPNIIDFLCHSYHISEDDKVFYKMVRAKFKHLCYAYRAFDARHQRPLLVGNVTGLLGLVQDGFKNQKASLVHPNAYLLKMIWSQKGLSFLRKEVNRFYPCDLESFVQTFKKRLLFIQTQITTNTVLSAHEFHILRKHISMFSAVYGTFDILYPSEYHHQTFQYIATINGLMGDYHDGLIEKKLNKTQNYFFDKFAMPPEIYSRLQEFTQRFLLAIETMA